MTFFGTPADQHKFDHAHESPAVMTIPLILLAVLSVGAGWFALGGNGWFEKLVVPYSVGGSAHGAAEAAVHHGGEHGAHSAHIL